MLNCRACLRQCLRAIDAAAVSNSASQRAFVRTYSDRATRTAWRSEADTEPTEGAERERNQSKENWIAGVKKKEKKSLTRKPDAPVSNRDPAMSKSDYTRRRRELQYLADPLELANFVKQELWKNKNEEMLQLVRMASRNMDCVVSWNHIIDYTLAQGKVSAALKIYNEMKKRAQFPDSYTYSILLKGISENAHESGALGKALAVYHSMTAENSRVQPSIVHTNAMLRVCARALDMDALWGVAAKIPDKGPGAANSKTYTTILNAIRQSLLVNVPMGETDQEVAQRRERGIMEGRRVWEEIIGRWRNADLVIDDDLVCAMGRLLLVGTRPRDWDDVLSLLEQTMDIPRAVPRLGTPERRQRGFPHLRAPNVPSEYKFDDDHLAPGNPPPRGDEFLPLAPQGVQGLTNTLSYVNSTNNTLSLALEASQKIVAKGAGDYYWNLLTDPGTYGIVPDINNLNMRLRVLRQNRASKDAVELLTNYFANKGVVPPPGTFRIAMSTCVRDKNNHNSLKHASQILAFMMEAREDADPKTVTMYCELAISFPLKTGADLVAALTQLEPATRSIRLQLGVGTGRFERAKPWLVKDARADAVHAIRRIYAVHDKLIMSDLVAEDEKSRWKAGRATLAAFLNRLAHKEGQPEVRGERRVSGKKWEAVKEAFNQEGGAATVETGAEKEVPKERSGQTVKVLQS